MSGAYVLRLTDGNCVIVTAADAEAARRVVTEMNTDSHGSPLDGGVEIVSVRELPSLALYCFLQPDQECDERTPCLSPAWNEIQWDIMQHEYPLLAKAFEKVVELPFAPGIGSQEPLMSERGLAAIERGRAKVMRLLERAMLREALRCRKPMASSAR